MKIYSSSFISIILGFLVMMGSNGQQVEVVQGQKPIHFENVVELEELLELETIRIEIFENLDCENCTVFTKDTLPRLQALKDQVEDLEIELFFVPNINEEMNNKMAMTLKCIKSEEYWSLHSRLHEEKGDLDQKIIDKLIKEHEVGSENLKGCIEESMHQSAIENDIKYASERGISTHPSLIINNYKLIGHQPFENIERVIRKIEERRTRLSPFDLQELEPSSLETELNATESPLIEETAIETPSNS